MKISPTLQAQMTWLCTKMPAREWSGKLLWTIESGSFEAGDAVISADYFYLLNLGSAAYTEYSTQESKMEWVKFLMANPQFQSHYTGKLHSHNSMGVFHSGTDNTDLKEQILEGQFDYYISLIVNNRNQFDLRVAFRGEVEAPAVTYTYKTFSGKTESFSVPGVGKQEVVCFYEGTVETESLVDEVIIDCYNTLKKAEEAKVVKTSNMPSFPSFPPTTNHKTLFDDAWGGYFDDDEYAVKQPVTGYTPESFLKKVLPSFRMTIESMLEEMEGILSGDKDTTDVAFEACADQMEASIDGLPLDFDDPSWEKLLDDTIKFINQYNLVFPNSWDLVTQVLECYKAGITEEKEELVCQK